MSGAQVRHVDPDGRTWGSFKAMVSAYGLTAQCVKHRLGKGLSLKQALRPKGAVKHPRTGEIVTWRALAAEVGVTVAALRLRYEAGADLAAPKTPSTAPRPERWSLVHPVTGELTTTRALAAVVGVSRETIRRRKRMGADLMAPKMTGSNRRM